MKPRQQRMLAVGLAALGIAIAAGLTLRAFQDNMMFFVEISDVVAGKQIGGDVVHPGEIPNRVSVFRPVKPANGHSINCAWRGG